LIRTGLIGLIGRRVVDIVLIILTDGLLTALRHNKRLISDSHITTTTIRTANNAYYDRDHYKYDGYNNYGNQPCCDDFSEIIVAVPIINTASAK